MHYSPAVAMLYLAIIDSLEAVAIVFGVCLGLYVLLKYAVRKICSN